MEKTSITISEFQAMTDTQLIAYLQDWPYKSDYENKDAYEHAEYRIALIQGRNYMKSGNPGAFLRSPC